MTETRKLVAILVSDVVGYSRLAGRDEELTLARLRSLRSDLIDPIIAVHHGRVVKRTGDGAIIEFRSVVDAVRCAIETQNGIIERNIGVPPERRIEFRIGIHLGDVMEESDGDLMGDGVNIAARLQSICEPNGICLSEQAYWQVKSRLDLAVTDLGDKELKNIVDPVRVYSLTVGVPAQAKPIAPNTLPKRTRSKLLIQISSALAALLVVAAVAAWYFLVRPGANIAAHAPAHLSIVVLPFANLSNDPKQDYFADGITDNLTTDLSRIRNSFVIARNTAFTYKGKSVDAKEIGKELGVRYVLEGSVQRDGNRVRVNAQLIDAESGAHLWADRFEEDLADLFKLQDDVVARLANTLGYELVKAEAERASHSTNPDAIDLTMQGWALLHNPRRDTTSNDRAMAFLDRALNLDPQNDAAMAGMATVELRNFVYGWKGTNVDYDAKIMAIADRAIALNLENTAAYTAKGVYLFLTNRAAESFSTADAGLAAVPTSAELFYVRSGAEISLGRFEQAKSDVLQAMRLSPHDRDMGIWHVNIGQAEMGLGHFEAAIEQHRQAIQVGLTSFIPYACLGAAYALAGRKPEAAAAMEKARQINPKLTVKWWREHGPNYPLLFEAARNAGLPEDEPPPPPKHLSIVVLPFTNLSGDPKQDYFADGITENLTTDLWRIRNSFVIARNTAFTFKGKNLDAKAIGKELGVRYVLEGSVQRDGNRVRVNAQLIDVESGAHLWADRFENERRDLFDMQDEIVTRVARSLDIQIATIEATHRGRRSDNLTADDLAMRCLASSNNNWNVTRADKIDAVYASCEDALQSDPKEVTALSLLAVKLLRLVNVGQTRNRAADLARAEDLVRQAVAIAPDDALVQYAQSVLFFSQARMAESFAEAERALSANPTYIPAYLILANVSDSLGRAEKAIEIADKAIHISPRDPILYTLCWYKAWAYLIQSDDRQMMAWADRSISLAPEYPLPYLLRIVGLVSGGQDDQAKGTYRHLAAIAGPAYKSLINFRMYVGKVWPATDPPSANAKDRLFAALRRAGMPEDEGPRLSIVVLPFETIGDPTQAYLADAITENLTTALSKLRDSFVIARNTAMTYKGKPVDVKQIGRDLGVRYVLEGSAQRGGDRVRVTAQLIDAETGAHLWADQFDQPRAELLDMQDAIVARLGRALDLKLTDADIAPTERTRSGNLDAEDLAMRCRSEFEQFYSDLAKVTDAYGLCQQALARDPRNVAALGLLAYHAIEPVVLLRSTDPASDLRKAQDFVARAFAVDPNDFAAHYANAWILGAQARFEDEEREADRSLESNPSYVAAYIPKCYANNYMGRAQKAVDCADAALRLSPRDPFANFVYLQKGFGQLQLDHYADAVASLRIAISLSPADRITQDQLGYNIIAQADAGQAPDRAAAINEAERIADDSLSVNQSDFFGRLVKERVLIARNRLDDAIALAAKTPPGILFIYFAYHARCDALAMLGRADDAIACADKLIALGPHQNLHVEYLDKGWGQMLQHKDDDAIAVFRKSVGVRPSASFPRAYLAAALGEAGHDAEAQEALKGYLAAYGVRIKTVAAWRDYWANWPSQNPVVLDFRQRFLDGLRKAGMPEQ